MQGRYERRRLSLEARESGAAGVDCAVAKLLLDAQKLVVLSYALGTSRCTGCLLYTSDAADDTASV